MALPGIPRLYAAALGAAAIVALACVPQQSTTPTPPLTVKQSAVPAAAPAAPAVPAGFPAPAPGPNLLAKDWGSRLGVIVSELKPATGQVLLNPKPGDLYFFSNASTAWGATNTKNAVWVIDAKTKKTVLEVAPADGEGASSHGIAVSGDGKYVYLPMLGTKNHIDVLDGRTFEIVQTVTTLSRPHHMKLWHDPVSGKDLMLGEDFNWNFTGSGMYVLDPAQKNAVVGGLSMGDFAGNPYVSTPAPDGSFIVVTVPAPTSALRDKMDGYLAKVDPKKWQVVGAVPMIDPLWAEVSLEGKYAYVTSGAEARVYKVNLSTMKIEGEVQTGPGPWGGRISYDQTKMYTADKGEGPGYNQQGRTATIIDLQTMGVTNVVPIGLTTDHAILSPDGTEVWFTSNADHAIYVMETANERISAVLKDPADGDIHGGVFVQYRDDGKGGVVGEVVADYSGLHGTALKAEKDYVASPALTIAMDRNGFLQKSVAAPMGQSLRLTIKNVAGTNGGRISFESAELGIKRISLDPGRSTEIKWTAPAKPGDYSAKSSSKPNDTLTIKVVSQSTTQAPTTGASGTGGPREIPINAKDFLFDKTTVEVKAGETVKFVLTNGDDEKHNLVGIGEVNLLSPDVGPGQTVAYQWTAPSTPQTVKVLCAYHANTMSFTLVIK